MPDAKVALQVRPVNGIAAIIDIRGELTAFAEPVLMKCYTDACTPATRAIILNFSAMEYMNSSGIGLIVTLLIRINRQKQQLFAYGLNDHYKNIFQLTRLSDSIKVFESEAESVRALRSIAGAAEHRAGLFRRR